MQQVFKQRKNGVTNMLLLHTCQDEEKDEKEGYKLNEPKQQSRVRYIKLSAAALFSVLALMVIVWFGDRCVTFVINNIPLVKVPINYVARECPKPSYETILSNKYDIDPKHICITTLTDTKQADTIQRLVRFRNFDNILDMTWPNKVNYAERHGYRLFNESLSLDPSRPPSWSKILAVKRVLTEEPNCEWVIWLDADTVIMNSNKRIEDILPSQQDLVLTRQKGHQDMIGKKKLKKKNAQQPVSYNAGAFIIRNTPWSVQFLESWWNLDSFVLPKGISLSGDNHALTYLLTDVMPPDEFEDHVAIPTRCNFNSVAVFARAWWDLDPTSKVSYLKQTNKYLDFDMEAYHKGDMIAHACGSNNKAGTIRLLLEDAI